MAYTNENQYDRRAIPDKAEIDSVEEPVRKRDMSSFEYFDAAMFDWVKDLNIHTDSNKGWRKVPVLWYGSERAYQVKKEKEIRDRSGTLILPIVTVGRTGFLKNPEVKGAYYANIPAVRDFMGGNITVGRRVKQKKTAEFNNNRAYQKTGQLNYKFTDEKEGPLYVYETESIHIPVYVETHYEINIWTSYQQQMNTIMNRMITDRQAGNLNYFTIEYGGYRFEAFMDGNFEEQNNIASLNEEDRRYRTKIKVKVLGYVIGGGKNADEQVIVKREGITKVKFGVEDLE
jgi:hypothetical protein